MSIPQTFDQWFSSLSVVLGQYPPLAMPMRELEDGLKRMFPENALQSEVDFINFVGDVLEFMSGKVEPDDYKILEKAMGDTLRIGEKADPALRRHKEWPNLKAIIERNSALGEIIVEDTRPVRR